MRISIPLLLLALGLTASACSATNEESPEALVSADSSSEDESSGEHLVSDTGDADLTDSSLIGYCAPESLVAIQDEVNIAHSDMIADEMHGPEVWAITTGAVSSGGTFESNELFDEAVLAGSLVTYYMPARPEGDELAAPVQIGIEDVGVVHRGARGDAPVFGSPSTIDRLTKIVFEPDSELVLGLLWNESLAAWGIRSAWYRDPADELHNAGDCGVLLTRELEALRDEQYPSSSTFTVLLSTPFDVADQFSYGPQDRDEPIDVADATRLGNGGQDLAVLVSGMEKSDALLCLVQGEESFCARLQAAGGEPFEIDLSIAPAEDVKFVVVDDSSEAKEAQGAVLTPEGTPSIEAHVTEAGNVELRPWSPGG